MPQCCLCKKEALDTEIEDVVLVKCNHQHSFGTEHYTYTFGNYSLLERKSFAVCSKCREDIANTHEASGNYMVLCFVAVAIALAIMILRIIPSFLALFTDDKFVFPKITYLFLSMVGLMGLSYYRMKELGDKYGGGSILGVVSMVWRKEIDNTKGSIYWIDNNCEVKTWDWWNKQNKVEGNKENQ